MTEKRRIETKTQRFGRLDKLTTGPGEAGLKSPQERGFTSEIGGWHAVP
jgi:hypothetical protein